MIALYTELTSLTTAEDCSLTDYVLEAGTAASSINNAGEQIRESSVFTGFGFMNRRRLGQLTVAILTSDSTTRTWVL